MDKLISDRGLASTIYYGPILSKIGKVSTPPTSKLHRTPLRSH
jgi:hypothetical protein